MCESATSSLGNGVGVPAKAKKGRGGDPAPPSALRRMAPLILFGYIFDTVVYFFVLYALLPSDLSPNPDYCPDGVPGCVRRDLFAFQAVSFLNLSFLGLTGVRSFFVARASREVPPTPQGRYFGGRLCGSGGGGGGLRRDADLVNAGIVVFQGWDFLASLFFEEHCTAIMMTHHLLAFVCGFFCLYYDVNHYYAVYFGGVSEFSSIFLCVVQLFEYYPVPPSFEPALAFSQAAFVVAFFVFRIAGWGRMSYLLLSDGAYLLRNKLLERHAPGSGWFLRYLMSMAVLLGALQVYWFGEIAGAVAEVLNG